MSSGSARPLCPLHNILLPNQSRLLHPTPRQLGPKQTAPPPRLGGTKCQRRPRTPFPSSSPWGRPLPPSIATSPAGGSGWSRALARRRSLGACECTCDEQGRGGPTCRRSLGPYEASGRSSQEVKHMRHRPAAVKHVACMLYMATFRTSSAMLYQSSPMPNGHRPICQSLP